MSDVASEYAHALVAEVLGCVRQACDTPLRFGIDAPQIAARAIERVETTRAQAFDPARFTASLDRIVHDALDLEPRAATPDAGPDAGPEGQDPTVVLAAWLAGVHHRLGEAHPLALHILGLRVEGGADREIAERLDLGLRLTQRITADMRTALTTGATTP